MWRLLLIWQVKKRFLSCWVEETNGLMLILGSVSSLFVFLISSQIRSQRSALSLISHVIDWIFLWSALRFASLSLSPEPWPVTRCCFDENKSLPIKINDGDKKSLFMDHTVDLGRGLFLWALVNGRNMDLGSLSISHGRRDPSVVKHSVNNRRRSWSTVGRKKRDTDRSIAISERLWSMFYSATVEMIDELAWMRRCAPFTGGDRFGFECNRLILSFIKTREDFDGRHLWTRTLEKDNC